MPSFKELFRFSETEVSCFFKQAKRIKSANGLKLLRCKSPLVDFAQPPVDYGKLLVVTPRKAGKAHDRNKIRRDAYAEERKNLVAGPGIVQDFKPDLSS